MIKFLIDPITHAKSAELTPGKEIKIIDEKLQNALLKTGITVTPEFKELNRLENWRVYPMDDKQIFAKAFEQIYFIHGLQQQGYVWEDKDDYKDMEKLAEDILAYYSAHKATNGSTDPANGYGLHQDKH